MTHSGAILLDLIEVASMVAIFLPAFSSNHTKATEGASGIRAGNGDCPSTLESF
jgi:hypothetical protein